MLVRQPLARFILPEDNGGYYRQQLLLLRTGEPQHCEVRLRRAAGDPVWVWMDATLAPDEASGAPRCQVTLADITERKQAEETLRQSEEFKDAILNSVAAHIAVLDGNGTIVAVNEPWRRFARENSSPAGEPARNLGVGANYLSVCRRSARKSAAGAGAVHDGIQAVLAGRAPSFALEYSCDPPGAQRWLVLNVTPLGGAGGGVVVAHSDITGRKQAEEALRRSERLLAETEQVGKVGGWQFDTTTGQQTWTEETYRIHEVELTYDPTVEKGVNFFTPETRPLIARAVQRAVEQGESYVIWNWRSSLPKATARAFAPAARPIRSITASTAFFRTSPRANWRKNQSSNSPPGCCRRRMRSGAGWRVNCTTPWCRVWGP
jgi:PAS domain-containing protein